MDKPHTRRATAKGIQTAIKPSRTLNADEKEDESCHIKGIKDRLVRTRIIPIIKSGKPIIGTHVGTRSLRRERGNLWAEAAPKRKGSKSVK